MAYQQQPGPGGGQVGGAPEYVAPQGTEYTLQGVMRFLQLEWHSHERARNSWDIERAEMKAKIAKQEGELRHSRKLNEQLDRQVKMLEMALRNERKKQADKAPPAKNGVKATPKPAHTIDSSTGDVGVASKESSAKAHTDAEIDDLAQPELTAEDRDKYRDKSRKYLEKCMQEIQYLLAPPPHPLPQTSMPNGLPPGLPDPPPPIHDERIVRQRHYNLQLQGNIMAPQQPVPNHQPLPMPRNLKQRPDSINLGDPSYETSDSSYAYTQPQSRGPEGQMETYQVRQQHMALPGDAIATDKPSLGYEVSARPGKGANHGMVVDEGDGWNFDDQQILPDPTIPDPAAPRRPDTDAFPSAGAMAAKSPPRSALQSHRRRSSGTGGSGRRRSAGSQETHDSGVDVGNRHDPLMFKVRFALRGHLDVVRSVIFTGGGSPSEPEICSAGDDGTIKRWIIPASYGNVQHNHMMNDLDIASFFTHRGHEGIITCLASCPSTSFSTGGRASGDGWIFSGGQDATIRVWERGRVDPKATLDGHTDAVWSVCVLPGNCGSVFPERSAQFGGSDRILLVSGSADGSVKVWAVSAPPHTTASQAPARRGAGRRHSVTSGSNHPSSPQPNTATNTPFSHALIHSIERPENSTAAPTCICPLSPSGDSFVVSYSDSSVRIFDTRTAEEAQSMTSAETYDGTPATAINTVAATSSAALGSDTGGAWAEEQDESVGAGPTGTAHGVEGVVVSGHEDRYIRFFDANSGQCTYTMLAHPSAISSLSLSPDGHEAVSAGHDASIRFWSLDKRICTQDITSHRPMRGEGVCGVVWSQDGRYVVSAGGDGVVKVFSR